MLAVFAGKGGSLISSIHPFLFRWDDQQGATAGLQRNARKSILHMSFTGKERFCLSKLAHSRQVAPLKSKPVIIKPSKESIP